MKNLPSRPNLRNLKNQAKKILKLHSRRDSSILITLRHLKKFKKAEPADIFESGVSLAEIQHALAMEYNFPSWNALRKHVLSITDFASTENFDNLLNRAMTIFLQKGPAEDLMQSDWERENKKMIGDLLAAGNIGLQVAQELSRSTKAKLRLKAALLFGLSKDAQSKKRLQKLLMDKSWEVRCTALHWYASLIYPDSQKRDYGKSYEQADSVPEDIQVIFPLTKDTNIKVRMAALRRLAPYAKLGYKPLEKVLYQTLQDPVLKVAFLAAKILK